MPLRFDNRYARLPARFYRRVAPTPVADPAWLAVNEPLGALLGLSEEELRSPELLRALAGNGALEGAEALALAYAGHQFGGFVPSLGDGRAILLGEVIDAAGARRDVQLKGAGPTPFSRGGDGRAAIGPVLREFLVSEAMHAMGVPTTRALAAVSTGEPVYRERVQPGAVLTRVASSHLRVGTFQYFAARDDREALATLTAHALARHAPEAQDAPSPALSLLDHALDAQARLVARWMALGFVHGVMNTDNCAISGETLDYGPCAFLDAYEPRRCFSSIDHQGRYAYLNQPRIAQWNLARLAEALLPLLGLPDDAAVALLEARVADFSPRFARAWDEALRAKLGLRDARDDDRALAQDLLDLLAAHQADYTLSFRALTRYAADGDAQHLARIAPPGALDAWIARWEARSEGDRAARAEIMRRANPARIPRNHRVEEALSAAVEGDLGPFARLRAALARPFDDDPDFADLEEPPGASQWGYRTFCGT